MIDRLKGIRVLIVDDELDILLSLIELLDVCVVDKATDYEAAKELLQHNRYDVAILDIMGVRGYDLLDFTLAKGIPTLMLTAHAMTKEDLDRSLESGAMAFIPKEKISEIDIYVQDVLEAQEKGLGKFGKWYKRLESFFADHFKRKALAYQKYVYWLDGCDFSALKGALEEGGTPMVEAKKAVCVPLANSVKIGFVSPDAWQKYELCKRQLSWYGSSVHAGQFLVVSCYKLELKGLKAEAVIRLSEFQAASLPRRDEKIRMIESNEYQKAKPHEWENIAEDDSGLHDKWLKIMGVRGISYEEIFITHCANHSNFIEPAYFISNENGIVPYSIAKTNHICSACLEFFNIIGFQFREKLVVPCPGAVLFAGMAPNRYYEVVQQPE